MELTIALALSILGSVISVLSFAFARKDKSSKDTENSSYKQGQLDMQLKNIFEKLDKIERRLDTYDAEIKRLVQEEVDKHLLQYHTKEK